MTGPIARRYRLAAVAEVKAHVRRSHDADLALDIELIHEGALLLGEYGDLDAPAALKCFVADMDLDVDAVTVNTSDTIEDAHAHE